MNQKIQILVRVLSIITAIILLQTLFYKFTGAEESIYIFETVGLEPFGRIGIGVLELVAAILLIYRKTTIYGGILSIGIISGAIFLHLTKLGIVVLNDGGLLFGLAVSVFILSLTILILKRNEIVELSNRVLYKSTTKHVRIS
jgi:hypothetical protein